MLWGQWVLKLVTDMILEEIVQTARFHPPENYDQRSDWLTEDFEDESIIAEGGMTVFYSIST